MKYGVYGIVLFALALLLAAKKNNHAPLLDHNIQLTILSGPIGLPNWGYNGHKEVMRSLCAGLDQLGIRYNLNPSNDHLIADTVLVMANVIAFAQAIGLKKRGKIKTLIVGPNVVERPRYLTLLDNLRGEFQFVFSGAPNATIYNLFYRMGTQRSFSVLPSSRLHVENLGINCWLVPSRWVRLLFESDNPSLTEKVRTWYAGVDCVQWAPLSNTKQSRTVLLYCKSGPASLCNAVEKILIDHGWLPQRLVYGFYTPEEYKQLLSNVQFAVFISKSETQGIALAQAWAMDVPTLVWNPQQSYDHGDWYQDISACPYISAATGISWQKLQEFQTIIESIEHHTKTCAPRRWVQQHMTDKQSAEYLLDIIAGINVNRSQ